MHKKYISPIQSLFNRLDAALILLILINIVNMLFPKGQGIELQNRWEDKIAYVLYAGVIILMVPSLFSRIKHFTCMNYMSFVILLYIMFAYAFGDRYNQNLVIRTFMVACSFVFFEDQLKSHKINLLLCKIYALSLFFQYSQLIISENRLMTSLYTIHVEGGQSLANSLVLIVPLIFYLFKGKIATTLYLIGLVVVFISLRRSAIIAYFLVIPFIYKQLTISVSKIQAIFAVIVLAVMAYYIISKYWTVLEMRFLNLYVANSYGEYGSGRTGWLSILLNKYLSSPKYWLQGFGLGAVSKYMSTHGYPFGHAHNGYVEILFTYGLIGFCLWFYTFVKIFVIANMYKIKKSTRLILYLSSFTYLLISLMSGTTYLPSVLTVSLCVNMILYNDKRHFLKNMNNTVEQLLVSSNGKKM